MGREVELKIVADYTAVIEAMRYGHADIARFSPVGYVQAVEQGADVVPLVFAVKKETGLPGYYAMLVARAETDTGDLGTLTFGFVDVGSTSGYVAPSIWLQKEGIVPSEMLFAGSHPAVILAVQNGSVDVGAVASNRIAAALDEGVIEGDEFKTVWQSPLIPNCPIAVQSSMPEKDKTKLVQLLLDAPESVVASIGTNETQYVKVTDSDYDPIREIVQFGTD